MAERSKAGTVFDRSNIGIADSNPARSMDVCVHLSELCCSVQVEALRWADPPAKESYQMSNGSKKLKQEPRMARHYRSPMLHAEQQQQQQQQQQQHGV
jgi:hypothetical protein